MARKRSPEYDWICRRCGCPCDPPGGESLHIGGGQGMRACGRLAVPVLRSVHEAEMEEAARAAVASLRARWSEPLALPAVAEEGQP